MDEKKEEKKKESIDEILSDLNGLLSKMPAILEGIELPEIRSTPPELTPIHQPFRPGPACAGDKEDLSEKAIKSDAGEPPPAAAGGAPDRLVLQSLSESMFSPGGSDTQGGRAPLRAEPLALPLEPAGLESAPELPEIKPLMEGNMPETDLPSSSDGVEQDPAPAKISQGDPISDLESLKGAEAAGDGVLRSRPETKEEAEPAASFFESTKDFGVPDIDALMDLSQAEASAGAAGNAVEASVGSGAQAASPAAPEAAAAADGGLSVENLIIMPPDGAESGKGGEMALKEGSSGPQDELDNTIPGRLEAAPEPVEPAVQMNAVPAAEDDEKTVVIPPPAEKAQVEAAQESPTGEVPLQGFTFEQPAPAEEKTGAIPSPLEQPQAEAASPQAFVLEPTASVSAAPASSDDEKTMIIAPPSPASDDEKTVIFEAGANPAAATQGASGGRNDLGALAAKSAPGGVKPEQVRNVAFLYAREDGDLCADMLAELDAVCLKSPSNPMFINRAFVEVCESGNNGNVVMQKVVDAKAAGLICLGRIPQETVYEIENVFTAAGMFSRHLTRESFSHSAVLDLVLEFMLK
jgi:hypothetical protein